MTLDTLEHGLRDHLAAIDAELALIRSARATDQADDEHDPEGSTLSSDWSRLEGLRADALVRLAEVDAARARIADGSYGVCAVCGRPIPPARLEARPTARTCVACAPSAPARAL